MKILITGGSGFIGTNLLDYYINKGGITLLSLDIKEPVKRDHQSIFVKCDILDLESLLEIFIEFDPDYIIHLAAKADLKGVKLEYYDANITGVKNIISASKQLKSLKKIIFASTMLVCRVGYIPKNNIDFCPPNLYGKSKVIGEQIIRNNSGEITWTIVRPSSIWGEYFGKTYRSFFEYIERERYFNFSGKMSTKTYGYVGNTVYQIDQLLFSNKSNYNVYYLGDYIFYSIKDWSFEIASILGKKIKTVPSLLIILSAVIGDLLRIIKIDFPMSKFRYKNMVTDNILPLENLKEIVPILPYTRMDGNLKTIEWMKKNRFI